MKKLFWAFWGPGWSTEGYAPEHFTEIRGLAAKLHAKRMKALYVSPTPDEFTVYENVVPVDEVKAILDFARARVAMMKQMEPRTPSADETENAKWFMAVADDPERRRWIFSRTSMEKLEELSSPQAWVQWLRAGFQREEAEAQRMADAELRRESPSEGTQDEAKWRMRIRIYTDSHSIRPKVLRQWPFAQFMRLIYVKNTEILVEFVIPKKVPIQAVWGVGFAQARRSVTALNIGTGGFFWWDLPKHISTYYDELIDLETSSRDGAFAAHVVSVGG